MAMPTLGASQVILVLGWKFRGALFCVVLFDFHAPIMAEDFAN